MKLYINNQQEKEIPEGIEKDIEEAVILCLKEERENTDYEISLTFVDNEEIKNLNRDFRDKDSVTDVLSFPMMEEDMFIPEEIEEEIEPLLGDIVISVERAEEQAEELGHSLRREIVYLSIHSMFHLLGYDHMQEDEKREMREKEKKIVRELKIFRN